MDWKRTNFAVASVSRSCDYGARFGVSARVPVLPKACSLLHGTEGRLKSSLVKMLLTASFSPVVRAVAASVEQSASSCDIRICTRLLVRMQPVENSIAVACFVVKLLKVFDIVIHEASKAKLCHEQRKKAWSKFHSLRCGEIKELWKSLLTKVTGGVSGQSLN